MLLVLKSLLTDWRWVLGTCATTLGWILFVYATSLGDISLIQPLIDTIVELLNLSKPVLMLELPDYKAALLQVNQTARTNQT